MPNLKRTFSVVGTSFCQGGWAAVTRLKPNQRIVVMREPTNKHDVNAVALYEWPRQGNALTQKYGYVPRGLAAEIAPIMDAGGDVVCHKAPNVLAGVCVLHWVTPDQSTMETAS